MLNKYINIPESKAPEDDFVSYLKKKKEAQEKAERHLKEKGVDFSIVPYCFAESAEVVNRLAEVALE